MNTTFYPLHSATVLKRTRRALCHAIAPLAATLMLLAAPCEASTREIAGTKVSDRTAVGGSELPLNGAGIRFRGPFKVYVAALYLSQKVSTAEDFFAARGPKRLMLTMLREADANEMGRMFMRGIQDNTTASTIGKVMASLPRMGEIFSQQKRLVPGDVLVLDWVPQVGMVVTSNGKTMGEPFREPEFFEAMLSIWLGRSPADWMLKDALLGK